MNPGYFGDAGGPMNGQTYAQGGNSHLDKQLASMAGDSQPPLARTLAHLIDQVNRLEASSTSFIDRLGPISRPTSPGESTASKRPEPQCMVDDELLTLVMRIDSVIERIEIARTRLCI